MHYRVSSCLISFGGCIAVGARLGLGHLQDGFAVEEHEELDSNKLGFGMNLLFQGVSHQRGPYASPRSAADS